MLEHVRHALPKSHPLVSGIAFEFSDDYLELLRLLVEAAGLEHSLMLSYLYASFSLRDEFAHLAGELSTSSYIQNSPLGPAGTAAAEIPTSLLGIAIEEMQHLSLVNKLLVALGAAPHVLPHVFPLSSDIYPFSIELRPFDRFSAATYLWLEASTGSFSSNPAADAEREDPELIDQVLEILWQRRTHFHSTSLPTVPVSHVGSIYRVVLRQLRRVAEHPPSFLATSFPWGEWEQRMHWVMGQGEVSHYRFFRDLFTGATCGGTEAWENGLCRNGFKWRTAYPARENSIPNDAARRIAWLSNLHYWCILAVLDLAFRSNSHRLRYVSIDHMTTSLYRLGRHLSRQYGVGLPFDAMSSRYTLGRDVHMTAAILERLVKETEHQAQVLDSHNLLPGDYDRSQFTITLQSINMLRDSPTATS